LEILEVLGELLGGEEALEDLYGDFLDVFAGLEF
jgi:hypothetical protein